MSGADRELVDLAAGAIGIYSPTYREDPAVDYFEARAAERSLPARRVTVMSAARERAAGAGGHNLIIEIGPQPPALVLVGHVDTVIGDGPSQASAREEADRLAGLGAADMKGACAAMLLAAADSIRGGTDASAPAEDRASRRGGANRSTVDSPGLSRGFAVHLLVGEEEYGDGAIAAVSELTSTPGYAGTAPPLVIVGEPTGLRPCTDHACYYEGTLRTGGTTAHAALPGRGANAISAMIDWLDEIDSRMAAHDSFVLNPRSICGGSDHFLVPDSCEARVDVHGAPETAETEIEAIVSESARFAEQRRPGRAYEWTRTFFSPGFRLPSGDRSTTPLRAALDRIGRPWLPDFFPSHSDAPTYAAAGMPTVVCGPGSLDVAHTGEEFIEISELVAARKLYAELIRQVCGV